MSGQQQVTEETDKSTKPVCYSCYYCHFKDCVLQISCFGLTLEERLSLKLCVVYMIMYMLTLCRFKCSNNFVEVTSFLGLVFQYKNPLECVPQSFSITHANHLCWYIYFRKHVWSSYPYWSGLIWITPIVGLFANMFWKCECVTWKHRKTYG